MSEQKFCKDCKYIEPEKIGFFLWKRTVINSFARCNKTRDPITAKAYKFCHISRNFDLPGSCGPEGRWWEPKG